MDFRYRASQTTHGFTFIFKNYFSVREDDFLDENSQEIFLKYLKLNVNNNGDEMCVVGLAPGEREGINEYEYLGYLRARGILIKDENQIQRKDRNDKENKNIEILWWYIGNTSYKGDGKTINKTDVGYGIKVPSLIKISNGYFSLLKIKQDDKIIYVELKWWDEERERIGVYCPKYIRSILGGLK